VNSRARTLDTIKEIPEKKLETSSNRVFSEPRRRLPSQGLESLNAALALQGFLLKGPQGEKEPIWDTG